jgi:hypothetical protein
VRNDQEQLLLTIQPADQSGEKKPQGREVDHGGVYINARCEPDAVRPSRRTLRARISDCSA